MFEKFSREQIARIVSFLFMGAALLGVDLSQYGTQAEFVTTAALLVSIGMDLWGYVTRLEKGDVTALGRRK